MTVYMVLAIAALAVLFWPASKSEPVLTIGPAVPASPRKQTYRSAMESLAHVRQRLVETEQLGEETREAINVITLALVSGSDKE